MFFCDPLMNIRGVAPGAFLSSGRSGHQAVANVFVRAGTMVRSVWIMVGVRSVREVMSFGSPFLK